MQYSISIIIPAFNDAQTLPSLIAETENTLKKITSNYEILIINDASQDDTCIFLEKIRNRRIKFSSHKTNLGHGITLKELYLKASKELLFSLPGNGQIRPIELLKLLPHISKHDMVIGMRKLRRVPIKRKVQSKIYNLIIRLLYGLDLYDINSVRLMKKNKLDKVNLESKTSFIDAELCYKFKENGFSIIEIPITHNPGLSRGGGSLKTILSTFVESILFRIRSTLYTSNSKIIGR